MWNLFKKNWLELSIFSLIFLILAFFASKTFLFYDDITFSFPTITKDYINFFKNYTHDYGLFRPLALFYYFFIYNFYLILPNLAHLIPLGLLTITAFLIFKILYKHELSEKQSISIGLLFLVMPFVTEAYSWISANTSIIVLFIFFLQIYLIEKNLIRKNLITILLILQIASVFFYESTIFMSFALAYLLYIKEKIKNKLHLVFFSIFPILTYFISKIIIRPQFENRSKLITISEIFSHWQVFWSQLKMLFSNNYIQNFWNLEFIDGLSLIKNNPLILVSLVTIFLFIIIKLSIREEYTKENFFGFYIYFWFFAFILSLIPLSWQTDYLPFRILILPILTFSICMLYIFNFVSKVKIFGKISCVFNFIFKIIFILLIFVFMTIQISMVNQYINQYEIDKRIVLEINQKLRNLGFVNPYRSNLYVTNFSSNNLDRLVYGDYIYGLFHNYWSAEALLDLNSGSFAKVAIEFPLDKNFSSSVSKDDFLKLRPLTIMSFTDNQSCLTGECLKVEAVYQKPY